MTLPLGLADGPGRHLTQVGQLNPFLENSEVKAPRELETVFYVEGCQGLQFVPVDWHGKLVCTGRGDGPRARRKYKGDPSALPPGTSSPWGLILLLAPSAIYASCFGVGAP